MRLSGKEEAQLLSDLHRECFPNYWNIDAFNDFFSISGTQAVLACVPDPAGMAVWRVQGEQADIITIAVRPAFRRQGLGAAMLEYMMGEIQGKGANNLFLDVEEGNTAAIGLYERYGFVQLNRRKLYYRQKDGSYTDALVMARKLD